jgi:flagellar biosynthesis protein FliR
MNFNFDFLEMQSFFLVIARTVAMISVMPAFSQNEINSRIKILLALFLSALITPIVSIKFIPQTNFLGFSIILLFEIFVGLIIGFIPKFLITSLDFFASLLGLTTGLNNSNLFNPNMESQTNLFSLLFTNAGTIIFLIMDFHHLLIKFLIQSYDLINFNSLANNQNIFKLATNSTSAIFLIGFKLGIPFIAINIILQSFMGILSRLAPQIQIFFLSLPLQILLGLFLLMALIKNICNNFYHNYFENFTFLFNG